MEIKNLYFIMPLCCCFVLFFDFCGASTQYVGQIYPGLEGSQMNWIDKKGLFLLSNKSVFALGFYASSDVTLFSLVVVHLKSLQVVWTANRGLQVENTDKFVFANNGNAYLRNTTNVVWSTNTADKGVTAMELQDTGNLVLLGANREIVWQSFSYPTDTLVSGQELVEGMKLKSFPYHNYLYHYLEIRNGDLLSYIDYLTPQVYWSMSRDSRKTVKQTNDRIFSALIVNNFWNFYDQNHTLVWQFKISEFGDDDANTIWAVVLSTDGSISFYNLERGKQPRPEFNRIPKSPCGTPEPCNPYNVCSLDGQCQCPSILSSFPNCTPLLNSPCKSSKNGIELSYMGDELDYFALKFVKPALKSKLDDCKEACLRNCSCVVLFFENKSSNCFLFDQVGSLKRADSFSSGVVSYAKVLSQGESDRKKNNHHVYAVIIAVGSVLAILGIGYLGFRLHHSSKKPLEPSKETSDEENFLDVSGMPMRFSYMDLMIATNNFSVKLGQGGFGSVYQGVLLDGSEVAVKKLEGIGQGKKEFRTEVSIIGSIHHVHLVKLKGFCSEGSHRLLVYEYMSKTSLDKWIFKNNQDGNVLDWEKRINIVLGMAKGFTYLHEGCDVKVIHCDIKPENILLDNNFQAKVSDFGLAKLMTREQSHVFTAVRGTRGYLAPEWITNYAISEKSDVFSFGMVVLEIIGERKNYDPKEISEKAHFPSYAFKMMEEGKLNEILDSKLDWRNDERAIKTLKVALWCIQDDMHMRPSMSKVVRMLEGICPVPEPPTSGRVSCGFYLKILESSSEEGNFSHLANHNSVALLSSDQLSGPR